MTTISRTTSASLRFSDELRTSVRLGLPLAAAYLAQMGMGLTDTILLGALGRDALAAGGLGAGVFFTTATVLQGLTMGVGILVAHARGAEDHHRIAPVLRGGFVIATLAALPLMLLFWQIEPILLALGQPDALARDVARYIHILMWGTPAYIWLCTQRTYLAAMNKPQQVFVVAATALLLNGFLNYGLIHGAFGLPEMGYLGSCTATAIALWSMTIATAIWMRLMRDLRPYRIWGRIAWPVVKELTHLGWPIAATFGVEIMLFMFGALMMGVLGNTALAAHHVTINIASVTFMIPLAMAQTANVRVSFHMGAQDPLAARQAVVAAMTIGVSFMALTALTMFAAPREIALLFNLDPARDADREVIALVVQLLAICAFFQVFDGAQSIAAGALRGYKDTRVPMMLAAFGYWGIGFPIAWALAFPLKVGPTGVWWGLALGLLAAAILLGTRLSRTTRRTVMA